MLKIINVTFLVGYCSLIFWLSSQSSPPGPILFVHQDKIIHLGAYFVMGILAWRFFNDYITSPRIVIIMSLCFCSLYGLSDEWHQSYVPTRESDILDWIADTLGASIAMLTIPLIKKGIKQKRNENEIIF